MFFSGLTQSCHTWAHAPFIRIVLQRCAVPWPEKKMCCAAGMSGSYHYMSNVLANVKEAQEHQFYAVFSGPQLRLIMTKKQGSGSFVYMNSVPFRKYIRALTEKKKKIIYGRFMTLGSIYQLIFLLLDLLINVIIKQFTL